MPGDHLEIAPPSLGQAGLAEQALGRPEDERERRAQLMAHVREQLAAQLVEAAELGVRRPQLSVRVVDLLSALEDLDLHLPRLRTQGFREQLLLGARPLEAHEIGDVLDPVQNVEDLAGGAEHGRVERAPVALFEGGWIPGAWNVVLLHRHRVRDAAVEHALERGAQVPGPGRLRVPRVVREHLEQPSPEDRRPLRHGRAQVGVADRDDREVGGQHEIEARDRLEQESEISLARVH